jgi:hypothetical protein
MKLKSFGCSFIFGTDLADDGRHLPLPTPSNNTWPANLSKHLGYEYKCHARGGAGNLQIAERVLHHATNNEPSFFVIGWTWIDRFDHVENERTNWQTVMPTDNDELAKFYYKVLHTEFKNKLCSLMYIKLVIDTLNQKNIPFLMTYMDPLLFDQQWHTTKPIIDLQKFIKPYMTEFDGLNFLEWSRKNNFEISPAWHPLESAHRAAADYMIKVFDKQKTVDPAQQVRA